MFEFICFDTGPTFLEPELSSFIKLFKADAPSIPGPFQSVLAQKPFDGVAALVLCREEKRGKRAATTTHKEETSPDKTKKTMVVKPV
jgi:hypothetical protein